MSIHVALTHATRYAYDRPVALGPQTIRLRPAPHARTPILAYTLAISPDPHVLDWQQDPHGNFLARVAFPDHVSGFAITVSLIADMAPINPFDFCLTPQAERFPSVCDPDLAPDLARFGRTGEPAGPLLAALLAGVPRGPQPTVELLVDLNRRVRRRIAYVVRMEPGVLAPERTLAQGQGSCRDSAWVLVQALRHLGFAARFCSGYLIQLAPDIRPTEGPPGPASDVTDLHAWAEVYLQGAGWVGLDATSGLLAGEGHIPLAATPDPASAAPVEGLVGPCETTFEVAMRLERVPERQPAAMPRT